MGSDTKDVLMKVVAPLLGSIIAFIMFSTPFPAVLKARKDGTLGDFNPIPYPIILANCCCWLGYGIVTGDPWVAIPNEYGLLIGLFYTISVYGLSDIKTRNYLLAIVMASAILVSFLGIVGALGDYDDDVLKLMWGFASNGVLFLYYAAPLSTVAEIFKHRSSVSIFWPLCLMNGINGCLWVAYGLAKSDPFIWVANGVGTVLAAFQLALCFIFPRKPYRRVSASDGKVDDC